MTFLESYRYLEYLSLFRCPISLNLSNTSGEMEHPLVAVSFVRMLGICTRRRKYRTSIVHTILGSDDSSADFIQLLIFGKKKLASAADCHGQVLRRTCLPTSGTPAVTDSMNF